MSTRGTFDSRRFQQRIAPDEAGFILYLLPHLIHVSIIINVATGYIEKWPKQARANAFR